MARYSTDRRLPDWEARFNAWLRDAAAMPYEYGRHDCMTGAVAGAVRAVTGRDLARGHRGKYASAAGAAKYLRKLGFDSPAAMLDSLLEPRRPSFARRGDIVLDEDGIPGVMLGGGRAAFVGDEGLKVAAGPWTRAWSVGASAGSGQG